MLTSLDLLIVVAMGLAALTLLMLSPMFLMHNRRVRRVCFYAVSALCIGLSCLGIRIGLSAPGAKLAVGGMTALAAVGSVVLERLSQSDETKFLAARLVAGAALTVSLLNVIL